jgi:hypothetical protein
MDGPSILTSFPPRGPKRERDARAAAAAAKTSASVCRYTKQVARNPRESPRCSAGIKFASNENLIREISSQSVFPMPRHGERFSPTTDVVAFCGLIQLSADKSSSLEAFKIKATGAALRAA